MWRILEVIFRRPLQLLLLILLLPLVCVAVAFFLPRSYQSTATLWALHRYQIIGATGPESDLLAAPADTQATALTDLLQSRTFDLSVANITSLPSTLDANVRADPQRRDDLLVEDISTHTQVTAQGYNVFVITYENRNPQLAQQVVQAIVQNFGLESHSFSIVEGQRLLASYQVDLGRAKHDVAVAAQVEAKYILAHPSLKNADLPTDPQYVLLHAQTQQAQATLSNIQSTIDTIHQEISAQGTGDASIFKVLDMPKVPAQPVSRMKTLLLTGGTGLGVALFACALYVLIAVRRDRTVYTPLELQKVTELPVIMQFPYLSETTVPLLVKSISHSNMPQGTDVVTSL